MDNITHSLIGAVLAQTGLKKKTGLAMPALVIGANLPDVDAACFFWLDGTEHLGFRRGITHGPPAMVLLPLMLAGLLWGFDKWQESRGKRPEGRSAVSFKWLYILSLIGCLSHPALDWLNVYGIRFLEPFSSQWFYGDTLFIIDLFLWAVLGIATWYSLLCEKRGKPWQWPAFVALGVSAIYIAGNWVVSNAAWVPYSINKKVLPSEENDLGPRPDIPETIKIVSPAPFRPDQRELILGEKNNFYVIPVDEVPSPWRARPVTEQRCAWPDTETLRKTNSQLDAFLIWTRAPFATRAEDGSVLLRDARFMDPLSGDNFKIALPNVKCEELPSR